MLLPVPAARRNIIITTVTAPILVITRTVDNRRDGCGQSRCKVRIGGHSSIDALASVQRLRWYMQTGELGLLLVIIQSLAHHLRQTRLVQLRETRPLRELHQWVVIRRTVNVGC